MGDVELTTVEQYERVTNINMLGMVRVTKAFLPMIRQSKGKIYDNLIIFNSVVNDLSNLIKFTLIP